MNRLFKTVTSSLRNNEKSVVPFTKDHNVSQTILIEELTVNMSIGILDHEKTKKQNVIIDIALDIQANSDHHDDINGTVSYADVIQEVEQLAQSKHFNLVETITEDIADLCLAKSLSQRVSVSVKKPDIISNTKSVGFMMVKEKD